MATTTVSTLPILFILVLHIACFTLAKSEPAFPKRIRNNDELKKFVSNTDFVLLNVELENCDAKCERIRFQFEEFATLLQDAHPYISSAAYTLKDPEKSSIPGTKTSQLPALIFYRNSLPIVLYDADFDRTEEVLSWLMINKQVHGKQLDDESFEHLTQASTGATTGDWLIRFCDMQSADCTSLNAIWEATAARLKYKMNLATVDTSSSNATVERFQISPDRITVLLFRSGKMYEFNLRSFDTKSLATFAEGAYKHAKASDVPIPKSPFDALLEKIVTYLKADSNVYLMSALGLFTAILLLLAYYYCNSSQAKKSKNQ